MEEGSLWSALERTAIAKMVQYVNISDCVKLEIDEVEDCSLGPELKQILRKGDNRRQKHFEVFRVKERGDHLVGLACDGMIVKDRKSQEEKA